LIHGACCCCCYHLHHTLQSPADISQIFAHINSPSIYILTREQKATSSIQHNILAGAPKSATDKLRVLKAATSLARAKTTVEWHISWTLSCTDCPPTSATYGAKVLQHYRLSRCQPPTSLSATCQQLLVPQCRLSMLGHRAFFLTPCLMNCEHGIVATVSKKHWRLCFLPLTGVCSTLQAFCKSMTDTDTDNESDISYYQVLDIKLHSKTREIKTDCSHLIPPQQHLYNGLACPAGYSIFA